MMNSSDAAVKQQEQQLTDYRQLSTNNTHKARASSVSRLPNVSAYTAATDENGGGTVEEEQAAIICNVPLQRAASSSKVIGNRNMEHLTPQRKISTSARFMNAFQQFYGSSATAEEDNEASSQQQAALAARTPTKGMESKLLSMWHNMKYGWNSKLRSNFSKEQPVWLLGRCYHRKYTPPSSMETSAELFSITTTCTTGAPADNDAQAMNGLQEQQISWAANACDVIKQQQQQQQEQESKSPAKTTATTTTTNVLYPVLNFDEVNEIVVPQELGTDAAENQIAESPWEEGIEGFRRDFFSRIWMTYRREFPLMNGTNYTSDCGWGCMLRSGQMLLAQGLVCHFLGRNWRYDPDTQLHSTYEDNVHKRIIKWFGDSSSKGSPFSIHSLVSLGEQMGKKPGDWYGPASVSYLLKQSLKNAAQENADFDNITIYVARDCTIYLQDIESECSIPQATPKPHVPWQTKGKAEPAKAETKQWKALIILIPLRLGTEKLNSIYAHCLKLLLSTEYCIGIIGGRPKHSLYFVGFQEDKLIHLDPHYCQEMVDVNQDNFPLHTFHCKSPRKMKTAKMDPSCCIGFYCQTKADFDNFVESVQLYLNPMRCASGTVERIIPPSQQLPNHDTQQQQATAQSFNEINYPLFSFSRGRCLENVANEMSDSLYKPLQMQLAQIGQLEGIATDSCQNVCVSAFDDDDDETEEFVLL